MIDDIFAKLPVKESARFRCVSKFWCKLLTAPNFFDSCLAKLSQGLLVQQLRYEDHAFDSVRDMFLIEHIDSDSKNDNNHVTVTKVGETVPFPYFTPRLVTSCNGLVCLYEVEKGGIFHVFNPLTKDHFVQVNSGLVAPDEKIRTILTHAIIGFGVSNGDKQYKVMKVLKYGMEEDHDDLYELQAQIYTIGDATPRQLYSPHLYDIKEDSPGVFLNGILHWIDIGESYHIMFDLQTEEFDGKSLYLPPYFGGWSNLGVSRGCLYASEVYYGDVHPGIGIWVMKEYGNEDSWVREIVISNRLLEMGSNDSDSRIEIVKISKDWKKVLFIYDMELFWYNSEDGSFNKPETSGLKFIAHSIRYVLSFISLLELAGTNNVGDAVEGNH